MGEGSGWGFDGREMEGERGEEGLHHVMMLYLPSDMSCFFLFSQQYGICAWHGVRFGGGFKCPAWPFACTVVVLRPDLLLAIIFKRRR